MSARKRTGKTSQNGQEKKEGSVPFCVQNSTHRQSYHPISVTDWNMNNTLMNSNNHVDEQSLSNCQSGPVFRGLIQMIGNQLQREQSCYCIKYEFDASLLQETQRMLQLRRRRRRRKVESSSYSSPQQSDNQTPSCQPWSTDVTTAAQAVQTTSSFFELLQRQGHRFVCFFVVQYANARCHSQHSLYIRKLLSLEYQDIVTTVVIMVGRPEQDVNLVENETDSLFPSAAEECSSNLDVERGSTSNWRQNGICGDWDLFCLGTGFALLPNNNNSTSLILSMLWLILPQGARSAAIVRSWPWYPIVTIHRGYYRPGNKGNPGCPAVRLFWLWQHVKYQHVWFNEYNNIIWVICL
jgi:hypothetical protein